MTEDTELTTFWASVVQDIELGFTEFQKTETFEMTVMILKSNRPEEIIRLALKNAFIAGASAKLSAIDNLARQKLTELESKV